MRNAAASRPQTVVNNTTVNQTVVVQRLEREASDLNGMIELYRTIIKEQTARSSAAAACKGVAQQSVAVLSTRMRDSQKAYESRATEFRQYVTSVRPNDTDLHISARRVSELFPKVPYFIVGTTETGDFWLEPTVTDSGSLSFNLKFVDTGGGTEKVRGTIPMSPDELTETRDALCKLGEWSAISHENRVQRNLTKRVVCFPSDRCPAEGAKRDGMSSTEVVFKVYDDGRTAGRIQRNRGRFEEGYDISVESALLLQAYLTHVLAEGRQEFDAGTRTDTEVRDLFK